MKRDRDNKKIALNNGCAMEFAWCPPGEFLMGSPPDEPHRGDDEDQHRVILEKGFWMGIFPVTQIQFSQVIGGNPSHFVDPSQFTDLKIPDYERPDTLQHPVEQVTWNEAIDFCRKFSEMSGQKIRLPKEIEWEYACRAGTTGPFFFENKEERGFLKDLEVAKEFCWWKKNSSSRTHAMGGPKEKEPNPWGLFHFLGHVWEWCEDHYGPYPRAQESEVRKFPAMGQPGKVLRGGSWGTRFENNEIFLMRCAARFAYPQEKTTSAIGFRVVWEE